MKKICNRFLFIAFAISYACFGAMAFSRMFFSELMKQPLYMFLFILGCLGPFIATLISYASDREGTGGLRGLWNNITVIRNPKSVYLIFLFLALHYGLAIAMGAAEVSGGFTDFIKYFPVMLALFGLQEPGWRAIVQPRFEEYKGFWRSCVITGLLWSVWFLPLAYVPGFVVHPDFFIQFAAYFVGVSILQTTIYKQSGSMLYCIIFSALFFALSSVFGMKQANTILAVTAVDIVVAATYNSKIFK